MKSVRIVGGGLAGSEACWQIVRRGVPVELYEMRPLVMTKAHRTGKLAELVCSNSFRGASLTNAVGLLKEELKVLGSLVMEAALFAEVPAGGALAVDRMVFSNFIEERIKSHPLVTYRTGEVESLPFATLEEPVIIATGPLTSPSLAQSIGNYFHENEMAFFDAISPIMLHETLDVAQMFRQSRYDKGSGNDYLNIPLTEAEYYRFVDEVHRGEKFSAHSEGEADLVENLRPFEGCMPIEEMISRGPDTLLFGPLKPVGLIDPKTGRQPFAVIQLRQDDKAGALWSMVGMQTRLRHPEQLRIFRSLPGLSHAEFVRLGSVHRNSFLNSPNLLTPTLESRKCPGLFFAGQITGVEGYVESTSGGLVAGLNAFRLIQGQAPVAFPRETAIGSLMAYISEPSRKNFQPMNISFGLMESYLSLPSRDEKKKRVKKDERRLHASYLAIEAIKEFSFAIERSH